MWVWYGGCDVSGYGVCDVSGYGVFMKIMKKPLVFVFCLVSRLVTH